jgi:hypothetical protein
MFTTVLLVGILLAALYLIHFRSCTTEGFSDADLIKAENKRRTGAVVEVDSKEEVGKEGFSSCSARKEGFSLKGVKGMAVSKEGFASCSRGSTRGNGPISEGFATHGTDARRMPECVNRSTDAQSLLARIADIDTAEADELRLLVSKLCCMEADIATPAPGKYRTMNLQFRTSQDTEPPVTIVSRCLSGAVNARDVELIIEKFKLRGQVLVDVLCKDAAASAELDKIIAHLQFAMTSFCLKKSPDMDRPSGPRDPGFWSSDESDLQQYEGISAQPSDD